TGFGIAVNAAGNAFVVGDTSSSTFPATGFQKSIHGTQDAFVAKLSADGTQLVYSTFLGGSGTDHGAAIAVDAAGNASLTGSTYSTDFPLSNAFQSISGGGQDAFAARIAADGNSLIFSTYLGGSGGSPSYAEQGQGIALDGAGNLYIAGITSSPNFPMIHPIQASLNGWLDAFVVKLTAAGWPVYSTYLGGSGMDFASAIAVDSGGNAYIGGYTYSTDLPVVNPLQPHISAAGDVDAFIGILNAAGSAIQYLSYLGGIGSDNATAVAVDAAGGIYVAGWTMSTSFPLLHSLQATNGGNYGAFLLKMQPLTLGISCAHSGSFTQNQTGTYTVTITNQSSAISTTGMVTVTDSVSSGLTLH